MGDTDEFLKDMLAKKRGEEPPPRRDYSPPPTPLTEKPFFTVIVVTVCILVVVGFIAAQFRSGTPSDTAATAKPNLWQTFTIGREPYRLNIPSRSCVDVLPSSLTVTPDNTKADSATLTITNTTPQDKVAVEVYRYPLTHDVCRRALTPTIQSILKTKDYTPTPDGGLETAPFVVGKQQVTIPIWNQYCIHIGRNGAKVKLVGTDGAMNDSNEAYYVSADGKDVRITVIYFPIAHNKCDHLR